MSTEMPFDESSRTTLELVRPIRSSVARRSRRHRRVFRLRPTSPRLPAPSSGGVLPLRRLSTETPRRHRASSTMLRTSSTTLVLTSMGNSRPTVDVLDVRWQRIASGSSPAATKDDIEMQLEAALDDRGQRRDRNVPGPALNLADVLAADSRARAQLPLRQPCFLAR